MVLSRSGLLGMMLLGVAGEMVAAHTVTAVPKLDLNQSKGGWHEIGRLPIGREKRCVGDVAALIAEGNDPTQLQLVMTCTVKDGGVDWWNESFRKQDKSGDGRLKMRTIWPLSKKIWVLAVGDSYEWALVGSPNHKNLWIYSRTLRMEPEVLSEVKAKAVGLGFPLEKLTMTPQSGRRETGRAAVAVEGAK